MAIFAVLSLMVVFTVLGVAAISIAQRDNSASGSVFDIKQREAAAYSGLVYAQNELARDPVNLLNILESWRLKTIYGTATAPYPALYLKFDATNKVALTTTKPAPFLIPGTNSSITVEVTGISLPATSSEEPNIALRSTGSGSSGDEQTLLGVYQIKNIRVSSNSATMPITHPLYISGGGNKDNNFTISDGTAYFGNSTHINSTTQVINLKDAGLRVNGDLTIDNVKDFTVKKNVYINGSLLFHSVAGDVSFNENVVVTGNLNLNSTNAKIAISKSLYVLGSPGFPDLQTTFIEVGKDALPADNAIFYLPNGTLKMNDDSWLRINGSAFIRRIASPKPFALDVSGRLELAERPLVDTFTGTGKWGQLVVRNADTNSYFKAATVNIPQARWGEARSSNGLEISGSPTGDSWVAPTDFQLGEPSALVRITPDLSTNIISAGWGGLNLSFPAGGSLKSSLTPLPSCNVSAVPTSEGFESGPMAPLSPYLLTGSLPPSDTNDKEPTVNFVDDPTALSDPWIPTGSPNCANGNLCGRALQEAYNANKGTRKHFHNDFFVVKLTGSVKFDVDLGVKYTSKLKGKFFFYVDKDMGFDQPWPTTDDNGNPANPENIQFIYAKGANTIFDGFAPTFSELDRVTPVVFTGYIRYDGSKACVPNGSNQNVSWTPKSNLIFRGAVHVVGPNPDTPGASRCVDFAIKSSTPTYNVEFKFDQAALNAIGSSFGTNFFIGGKDLGPPPNQFLLMENWVQFRTLGELR